MTPTPKPKVRKRKPRPRKRKRGVRTREGQTRPADAGSPVQPLIEILNETTKRRKPKKKAWAARIPISDDPLEKNIVDHLPMPDGYVLVRKGDVYVTRHCRSKTKESGRIVYVVYNLNRKSKRSLGIRVPEEIHNEVLELAAETKQSRAKAVQACDARDLTKYRELLQLEFPLMPKKTLKAVLEHAFLKGSGRVGRTGRISDEQKALFAVEAHIRHVHTPYEKLLEDGVSRKDAREQVWSTVQAVERAWQGCEQAESKLTLRPAND